GGLDRIIDIGVAQHRATHAETFVIHSLVHRDTPWVEPAAARESFTCGPTEVGTSACQNAERASRGRRMAVGWSAGKFDIGRTETNANLPVARVCEDLPAGFRGSTGMVSGLGRVCVALA